MKSFITALAIAAALISGSLFYMSKLETASDELSDINKAITANLTRDEFKSAYENIKKLRDELERVEPFLAMLGNHEEIDNIESNLAELEHYTEGEHKVDAIAKTGVLSFLFEHLPKNSRLKIENIL